MVSLKNKPKSLRRALILSILFIHVTVFIVMFFVNFLTLFRISEKQTLEEAQNNLEYLEYQMDNLVSNLSDIRNFLLQDQNVMEYLLLERTNSLEDINLQISVSKRLSQLIQSYTYLDSITLFQWNNDVLTVSGQRVSHNASADAPLAIQDTPQFQKITAASPLTWGGCYLQNEMFPNKGYKKGHQKEIVCILMPLVNVWHPDRFSIVSINIPRSYFNLLYSKNAGEGANVYLFGEDGGFLLKSSSEGISNDASSSYGYKIVENRTSAGHFTAQDKTSKYNVIFRQHAQTGWFLAEEIPYSVFLSNMMYLQSATGLTFLLSTLVIILICYLIIQRLLRSLSEISDQMADIGQGNLQKRLPAMDYTELNLLTSKFNSMMGKIENLIEEKIKYEQEQRVLEIEVLQSQINPHFLYNSLTTIRWMASMARAGNVCQAILALNNVLQPVFSQPGILWSINKEQNFVQNYIDIMNYRFGDNIKCIYDISEEVGEIPVLRFLLQPAVENCITHGLRGMSNGLITISAGKTESILTIKITDNGYGIEPDMLEKITQSIAGHTRPEDTENNHGFGLYNVNRRIKLHYGEEYGLSISSATGEGTTIQISIPA